MYRDYEGEPVYVGPPSEEIDANWDALLKGSGLDLSGAEADSVKDWTFEEAQGGLWRTGYGFPGAEPKLFCPTSLTMNRLDVFHQLHCLNFVRKSLDLDYYRQDDPTRLFLLHRGKSPRFPFPSSKPSAHMRCNRPLPRLRPPSPHVLGRCDPRAPRVAQGEPVPDPQVRPTAHVPQFRAAPRVVQGPGLAGPYGGQ